MFQCLTVVPFLTTSSLFALVCNRKAIPRRKATAKYKLLNNPNLAQLIAQGSIFWPPAGEECYVFIYMDNLGKPLLEPGGEAALGWKPEKVLELIVKPMVNVFQDFKDRDFVHGAISPYNMFGEHEGDTTRARKIILGDCFSVPPSYRQTAL